MIPLTHCKNKKIFVLGLGLSGDSAIRALESGGANVSAWDDNDRVRKNYFGQGKNIINPKEISIEDFESLRLLNSANVRCIAFLFSEFFNCSILRHKLLNLKVFALGTFFKRL